MAKHYHLMEDEELIELARSPIFAGSLSAELANRLEQAFDPETGMTAAELSACKQEADDLEREVTNLKQDIERLEGEVRDAEERADTAEDALEQLRETEDATP